MIDIGGILNAIAANDPETVRSGTLSLLASGLRAADGVMDVALAAGDWLFEHGQPAAGAEVYRAAIEQARAAGLLPQFEEARLLDRLAGHLADAGQLDDAADALSRSVQLSQSGPNLDDRARLWRLGRLADLEARRGNAAHAEARRSEGARLARNMGVHELSAAINRETRYSTTLTLPHGIQFRGTADALRAVPPSDDYLVVPVHFATHRMPRPLADPAIYDPYDRFGAEPSPTLHYGHALVTVPANRRVGSYVEPSSGLFGNGGAPEKSFTVQTVDLFANAPAFLQSIAEQVGETRRKEVVVFLHGYHTTLAGGLMRAAQLKVDMKIDGAVVLYSLPSKGTLFGYGADRIAAQRVVAQEQVRDLLTDLARTTGATRIHLVAHSLGCEMLIQALNKIWEGDGGEGRAKRRFTEVVFAAPDVDHGQFTDLVSRVAALTRRVTVYASSADLPLWMIGTLVERERAGFDVDELAGLGGVEAVDTTGGKSWFASIGGSWGHWDFADGAIDDVRAVVWLSLNPPGRDCQIERRTTPAGAAYCAVVPKQATVLKLFREALEWSRELEIDEALRTATNAAAAERAMIPPGSRLSEFEGLQRLLQLFMTSMAAA